MALDVFEENVLNAVGRDTSIVLQEGRKKDRGYVYGQRRGRRSKSFIGFGSIEGYSKGLLRHES